ncbi:MAG: hypothetical protein AAGB07_14480 [Pseudomonadota bacterium]
MPNGAELQRWAATREGDATRICRTMEFQVSERQRLSGILIWRHGAARGALRILTLPLVGWT